MTPEVFILCGTVAAAIGYLHGWRSKPDYREGCNECDAVQRRARERQQELNHDYAHKGAGFRDEYPDIYSCSDPTCPRNPERPLK